MTDLKQNGPMRGVARLALSAAALSLVWTGAALGQSSTPSPADAARADAYFFVAQSAFEEGRLEDAVAAVERAESVTGQTSQRMLAIEAKALTQLERFDDAKSVLDMFYSTNPDETLQRDMASVLIAVDDGLRAQAATSVEITEPEVAPTVSETPFLQPILDAERKQRADLLSRNPFSSAAVLLGLRPDGTQPNSLALILREIPFDVEPPLAEVILIGEDGRLLDRGYFDFSETAPDMLIDIWGGADMPDALEQESVDLTYVGSIGWVEKIRPQIRIEGRDVSGRTVNEDYKDVRWFIGTYGPGLTDSSKPLQTVYIPEDSAASIIASMPVPKRVPLPVLDDPLTTSVVVAGTAATVVATPEIVTDIITTEPVAESFLETVMEATSLSEPVAPIVPPNPAETFDIQLPRGWEDSDMRDAMQADAEYCREKHFEGGRLNNSHLICLEKTPETPVQAKAGGTCDMTVDVLETGRVANVSIEQCSDPLFVAEAVEMTQYLFYMPAVVNGIPVVTPNVPYKITFNSRGSVVSD